MVPYLMGRHPYPLKKTDRYRPCSASCGSKGVAEDHPVRLTGTTGITIVVFARPWAPVTDKLLAPC